MELGHRGGCDVDPPQRLGRGAERVDQRRADHGARSDRDEGSLLRRLMIKPVTDARDELAHALPAVRCRVKVGQPRRHGLGLVALDFVERVP